MKKNPNQYFPIPLYKTQVQVNQRSPHKTRYTENIRRESEEEGGSQKMERSPMLMDWKNQHHKNGHPTKSNLQIQCNPHQNSNPVLHGIGKIKVQFHIE